MLLRREARAPSKAASLLPLPPPPPSVGGIASSAVGVDDGPALEGSCNANGPGDALEAARRSARRCGGGEPTGVVVRGLPLLLLLPPVGLVLLGCELRGLAEDEAGRDLASAFGSG